MHHFLNEIKQFMLNFKRVQFTSTDFLQSLHIHQFFLIFLLSHFHSFVSTNKFLIVLFFAISKSKSTNQQIFSNLFLNNTSNEKAKFYIFNHFSSFSNQHTYKTTSNISFVNKNFKKMREFAIRKTRLKKIVLRKLMNAKSNMNLSIIAHTKNDVKSLRVRRDDVWKKIMQIVIFIISIDSKNSDDMQNLKKLEEYSVSNRNVANSNKYLNISVNVEKQYWKRIDKRQFSKFSVNNAKVVISIMTLF